MSLFKAAKEKSNSPKTSKKDDKVRITIKDPDFFYKIERLEILKDNQKRDKAQSDILDDEIKEVAKLEWAKLYQKTGKNPGSIILESINGRMTAQTMFVPSDKYISINKERADLLVEKYGEEIVEEKTTFSFDDDMVNRYGDVLSRLIEESDEIEEEHKDKIIKAITTFSIKKGTIDDLKKFGPVQSLLEEVSPVLSLKNVSVIKPVEEED